eukprot:m.489478 g.489478  ORF g.489478 m.489478 type:complete len:418 (-) comp57239_c1_seq6:135-1388(-)
MEALDVMHGGTAFSLDPQVALHYQQQIQTQQQQIQQYQQQIQQYQQLQEQYDHDARSLHKRPKSLGTPRTPRSRPDSAKNSPLTKDGEHSAGQDGDYLTRLSSPEPKKIIRSRGGVVPEGTPEGKIFPCMDCGKQYLSQPGLRYHLIHAHGLDTTKPREPICRLCGKIFETLPELDVHMSSHEAPGHICPTCNAKFASSGALHKHQETHEVGPDGAVPPPSMGKTYTCAVPTCQKVYSSVGGFAYHMSTAHPTTETDRHEFHCTHEGCEKSFVSRNGLNYHVTTHAPVKVQPHRCTKPNCTRQFSSYSGRSYHERRCTGFESPQAVSIPLQQEQELMADHLPPDPIVHHPLQHDPHQERYPHLQHDHPLQHQLQHMSHLDQMSQQHLEHLHRQHQLQHQQADLSLVPQQHQDPLSHH